MQADGVERPIAFASRVCRGPERSLDSPSGELAAAIFALTKFREYVGYNPFDLVTDSTTVRALTSGNKLSGKLARWAIFLSEFRMNVVHKAGATLGNVDGLSRAAAREDSEGHQVVHMWEAAVAMLEVEDEGGYLGQHPCGTKHLELATSQLNASSVSKDPTAVCAQCGKVEGGRKVSCGKCGRVEHKA